MEEKELRWSMFVFSIDTVMKLTGLLAQQVRYYEEQDLVRPGWSGRNQRMYSLNDTDMLLKIKDYLSEGLSMAGVKRVYEMVQVKKQGVKNKKSLTDHDARQIFRDKVLAQGGLSKTGHYQSRGLQRQFLDRVNQKRKGDTMVKKQITGEETGRIIEEENIRFLRLMLVGILDTVKNVEVPMSQTDKVLENKMMFDGSSIERSVWIEGSDIYLYPGFFIWMAFPWESAHGKVARLICDIYSPGGILFADDPRGDLERASKDMRDLSFTSSNLGPEPEFFLFKLDEDGEIATTLSDKGGCFDFAPTDLGENYRRNVVLELENLGFEVETSYHEVMPGQHEVDFKYADVVDVCDNIQILKLIARMTTCKCRLRAVFIPKPLLGANGSNMHCSVSLFNDEGNVFYGEDDGLGLSGTAYYFLDGLPKHARAYIAVYNPTVNSYKRLVPDYEAPVCVAWSGRNRSPLVCIPGSRGLPTRLELRSVNPSANPYLIVVVLLRAGLDGIRNQIASPAAVDRGIYVMGGKGREAAHTQSLSSTIHNAIKELRRDNIMIGALGQHTFSDFVGTKRLEWTAFRQTVPE